MSYCDSEIEELLSAYLDHELTPEEHEKVENHLAQCPSCRQELKELEFVVQALRQMPTISLPVGFEEEWKKRLQMEQEKDGENTVVPFPSVATTTTTSAKTTKKYWFQSRKFIGIAATVLLCFSVSVIGKHINIGYEQIALNGVYADFQTQERSFQERASDKAMLFVANGEKNSNDSLGAAQSSVVRDDIGYPVSSRDGGACPLFAPKLNKLMPSGEEAARTIAGVSAYSNSLAVVHEVDGMPKPDSVDNSSATVSGTEGTELQNFSENTESQDIQLLVENNEALLKSSKKELAVAQDASGWEVYNGYLALTTENLDQAKEDIAAIASRYHGFITEETTISEEDESIRIEICVEKDSLKSAMKDISALGNVTAKSLHRVDLSGSYYDAQGRLTRQRALEKSLLRLISESNDLESILSMKQELEKVTVEIESIISELEQISAQRKYSTLVISIAADPVAAQVNATMADKFQLGLHSFAVFCQEFPSNFLVGFGFMFEILAVLIILFILLYLVLRKVLGKTSAHFPQK